MEVASYQSDALRAADAGGVSALWFAAGTPWGRHLTEARGASGVLAQEQGHESTGDAETGGNSGISNVEDALLGTGNLRGRDADRGAERGAMGRSVQPSALLSDPFEDSPLFRTVPPPPSWAGESTTPPAAASGAGRSSFLTVAPRSGRDTSSSAASGAGEGTLLAVAPWAERSNTTDCGQQQASPFDALEDALLQDIFLRAAAQAPLTPFRCQAVCRRWRAALGGPRSTMGGTPDHGTPDHGTPDRGTPQGTPQGAPDGTPRGAPKGTPTAAPSSSSSRGAQRETPRGTPEGAPEDPFWEQCFQAAYHSSPPLTVRGHRDLALLPADQYCSNWYTVRYTRAQRTRAAIRAGMSLLGGGAWLVRDTSDTPWRLKYQNHMLVCQAMGL